MLKQKIDDWLDSITREGDLPSECRAIYVGLFESADEYKIYLVGSTEFDSDDDDWACPDDTDYEPKNKYLPTGVSTDRDWADFEQEVITHVREARYTDQTILSQTPNIGIGFDAGDITIL